MLHAAQTDIIEPKTAKTIAGLFRERARRSPYACAYRCFNANSGRFEEITWEQVSSQAARWQLAFEREGLHPGDRVAVAIKNCLEWVLFDLAALGLGLVTVPLFADDRPENSIHILRETGPRLLLIEEEQQWLRIREVDDRLTGIERIVALHSTNPADRCPVAHEGKDDAPLGTRISPGVSSEAAQPTWLSSLDLRLAGLTEWLPDKGEEYAVRCSESKTLATIVYTSGTTGMPKGVMLSHANILENAFACIRQEALYPEDVFLSFLPLSHTFERTVGYYIPMMTGACVAYVRSVDKLPEDLLEVRPTVLVSVPRIYERIYEKIITGLEGKAAWFRYLFQLTVETGWKRFCYVQGRAKWTPLLLLWPLLNRVVANRLRAVFGGRLRLSISGGASLAFPVARVFIGLGLNLLQGYGLTETSPVISVNTTNDNIPDTVGRLLPGVESAMAANGELLVRGPNVMLGYWNREEASAAAIDRDGFFHTGDLARMDEAGHLAIVGRLKEIIVLSTGEKVPPEDLELAITVNPLFEQAMVVGEGRPYLAALVVLNRSRWRKVAADNCIHPDHPDKPSGRFVEAILLSEIARHITRFPKYAQIRRVFATFFPWTLQDGLITATLKLRRKKLLARFSREVELLYKGH